jgi:hypothetical protein
MTSITPDALPHGRRERRTQRRSSRQPRRPASPARSPTCRFVQQTGRPPPTELGELKTWPSTATPRCSSTSPSRPSQRDPTIDEDDGRASRLRQGQAAHRRHPRRGQGSVRQGRPGRPRGRRHATPRPSPATTAHLLEPGSARPKVYDGRLRSRPAPPPQFLGTGQTRRSTSSSSGHVTDPGAGRRTQRRPARRPRQPLARGEGGDPRPGRPERLSPRSEGGSFWGRRPALPPA